MECMGEREDGLVSAKEIAARFNMPVSTVYWMADTGRIPFVNEGKPYYHRRRLLFDPVKVQAALLTGQTPAD
jgi:hypothetical protein